MKILQPAGWPRPKGYSNGVSAKGRMIFTAGIVGWDEREMFPDHRLHGQFAQALRNTLAILAEDGAGPEHIVRMTCWAASVAWSFAIAAARRWSVPPSSCCHAAR